MVELRDRVQGLAVLGILVGGEQGMLGAVWVASLSTWEVRGGCGGSAWYCSTWDRGDSYVILVLTLSYLEL